MKEQVMETSGADVLFLGKKLRKTLWGGGVGWHPPPLPSLYVRGLTGGIHDMKTWNTNIACSHTV